MLYSGVVLPRSYGMLCFLLSLYCSTLLCTWWSYVIYGCYTIIIIYDYSQCSQKMLFMKLPAGCWSNIIRNSIVHYLIAMKIFIYIWLWMVDMVGHYSTNTTTMLKCLIYIGDRIFLNKSYMAKSIHNY